METQSPTGFSITSNGNSSPAELIGGILSRASLPHRVVSSLVYSPMELSSPAGLFLQSSSFAIPSGNKEFSSFLQQLYEIYFPQPKHYISIHHDTCIYASLQHNLIYFENIIAWYISCIAYDWPLPFRKEEVKFPSVDDLTGSKISTELSSVEFQIRFSISTSFLCHSVDEFYNLNGILHWRPDSS